ncbi:UDP-glucose 4-epimerase GalE [Diaphorobacter ruginosibacter]|uniref:UDP-glucose 4-epimerase n=1 Tax=Diaphorobacter ruginosibacter TaxID=1715720 RepID=A0A7G9RRB9_9BURK|nr:UDP-glucose 4-epimerase GalE [Diaphorobacter ruginosibacter]QNN58144.1 UDP-glucose 4-epimerase GalE [Diaphorobacter ruginosibacter]
MILVTGGAGFIGSHTCAALAGQGLPFVVLDNFANSKPSVLERLARITGQPVPFVEGDVRDHRTVANVLRERGITSVIHFAGLKAVGESVSNPLKYYDTNVAGTVTLLSAMREANVRTLVFSSSATVYGDPISSPIPEDAALHPMNPYGHTKHMAEQIMADLDQSEPGQWRLARLRYFNPVGAHESGLIGEDPQDIPNNLMPFVAQVAAGVRQELSIFGGDYPTADGTGVRDYIHVSDLAEGHVAALRYLQQHAGLLTLNLGTGDPVSVLQMVQAFERACGKPVPYRIVDRRPGDVPAYWADPASAERLLGWRATRNVDQMCADVWRWQNGEARRVQ